MTETVDRLSGMQPVAGLPLSTESETVDKTVIERLILEHSDRLELEINQKARADAWKYYYRVRVDHRVRPFAVCKVCYRVLHCDSRSGTASLLRHPCNPLSERSPVNRAVKLSAKLNLPSDSITKGELYKSLIANERKLNLHDHDPLAAFRHPTSTCPSPSSTDSSPSLTQVPISASVTLSPSSCNNNNNGTRKRKVGAQSPVFPLDLRLLQLPQMMAAVAAHPLAALNLANATALLSDPQQLQQLHQQQSQIEHFMREQQQQQHLFQEREIKRNKEDDQYLQDRSRNIYKASGSTPSPSWPKTKIKKERNDFNDTRNPDEARDFSITGELNNQKDNETVNGAMTKEMVQQLITSGSSRVFLTDKDSAGAHYISGVWARFYVVYVDGLLRPFAACRSCRKVVTYTRYSGTGGLLRHRCASVPETRPIDVQPSDQSNNLPSDERRSPLEEPITIEPIKLGLPFPPKNSMFNNETNFGKESSHDKATMMASIAKALLRYMCHDMVSASTFDSPAFQHMVRTVLGLGAAHGTFNSSDQMPSSKQLLNSFLNPIVTDSKETIVKNLVSEKYLCLSLNCQVNDSNNKLAVSVHTVNSKFELVSHALGIKSLYKSDLRDDAMQEILDEYFHDTGSSSYIREKIVTIVADDGEPGRIGSNAVKCIWHSIENVMSSLQEISGYTIICDEVSGLISCLSESGIEGELASIGFQSSEVHRWEILLHAITFMLGQFDDLRNILATETNQLKKIVLSDQSVYGEIHELLSDIQRCLMTVRDYKRPTLNQASLCRAKLLHVCSTSSSSSTVAQMKEFLRKRFEEAIELSPLHMVASFLDPRCKSLKVLSDPEKGEVHKYVLEMMKAVSVTEANSGVLNLKTRRSSPTPMPPSPAGTSSPSSYSDGSHPFSEFMDSPTSCDLSVSDSEEIMAYANMKVQLENDDILAWWSGPSTSGLPTLRRLARKLLAVPATCTYAYQMNNHASAVTQKMGIADQNLLNSVLHMKYNTV